MPAQHPHSPLARRAEDSSSHRTTIIIIAVCASVGGIIVTVALVNLVRSCVARRASKNAQLPPIQPLAHHREQQVARFQDNRQSAFYDPAFLSPSAPSPSSYGSNTSLLGKEQSPSPSRYRRNSSSATASETAEDLTSPAMIPLEPSLPMPNPPFGIHPGPGSTGSGSSIADSSEDQASSAAPSPTSATFSSSVDNGPTATSRSKPRPTSYASISTTMTNKTSRSTIRRSGLPHGPHSNVQIVLPTPLAPSMSPYLSASAVTGNSTIPYTYSDIHRQRRLSVVDQWAPVLYRSESSARGLETTRSSSISQSSHRRSTSAQSHSRRRRSSAPNFHHDTESISSRGSHPPVPPLPVQYMASDSRPKSREQLQLMERDRRSQSVPRIMDAPS